MAEDHLPPSRSWSSLQAAESYELNSPPQRIVRPRQVSFSSSTLLFDAHGNSNAHGEAGLSSPIPIRTRDLNNFTVEDIPQSTRAALSSSVLHGLGAEDDNTWEIARGMKSRWRKRLYLLMEEPTYSPEALVIHGLSTGLILFSALLTILSTLPGYHTVPSLSRILFGLDTTVVVLFTFEYLARLIAHADSWIMLWDHATTFFSIIDLLAIFPFYLEVIFKADTSVLFRFSILRTFRLLRVFKAFRYSNTVILTIEVMRIAIKLSQDALLALGFFILMVLIIFSTLVYFAERGSWDDTLQTFVDADGDPSNFGSIPAAAWFVLVTITTVGYGEITPRSTLGRLVTVPLLVFGLLLIALPSFVLGRNFASVWDALRQYNAEQAAASEHLPVDESTDHLSPRESSYFPTQRARSPIQPLPINPMTSPDASTTTKTFRASSMVPQQQGSSIGGGSGVNRDGGSSQQDLSNFKLAKNQEALSVQIDGLREIVERQAKMIEVLLQNKVGNDREAYSSSRDFGLGINQNHS